MRVKAYNHLLGECGVVFFAARELAADLRRGFPRSLDGAPFLLPGENTELRRSLDAWLQAHDLHPQITSEFDDSALLKVFGQAGRGVFAAPAAIEKEVRQQFGVRVVGRADELRERFYAITV